MQHRDSNTTTYENSSLISQEVIPVSDRAFSVPSIKKPLSALGISFLRFCCPSSQINQYSRKKKSLRSKMFTAIFTAKREVYANSESDSRRAKQ